MTSALFGITERAAQKILALAAAQNKPESILRLRVVGGGCSGLSYEFGFTESSALSSQDKVFEGFGAKVAVDPKALLYVAGSELDYEQTLMKSGFKIKNPNAASSCSCGESFSV
jgi:iron-sulfur cluster assembly accessory protein